MADRAMSEAFPDSSSSHAPQQSRDSSRNVPSSSKPFSTTRPLSFGAQMMRQDVRYPSMSGYGPHAAETQGQTIQGDSNREPLHLEDPAGDSDREEVVDSNLPRTPAGGRLTPPATNKHRKSRRTDPSRRLTVDPPRVADSGVVLTITDNSVDPPVAYVMEGAEGLQDQVTNHPDEMFDNLHNLHETYCQLDALCRKLSKGRDDDHGEIHRLEASSQAQREQIADLKADIATLRNKDLKVEGEVSRLRQLRNEYRDHKEKLTNEAIALRISNDTLTKEVKGLLRRLEPQSRQQDYMGDSDEEERGRRHEDYSYGPQKSAPPAGPPKAGPTRILQRGAPLDNYMTDNLTDQQPRQQFGSRKHEELPMFYGDHTEWRGWKNHLLSQVDACPQDFPTEQSKINYARNKTRKTAQDTIWFRAAIDSVHPYLYLDELVQDLENIYGEDSTRLRNRHEQELFSSSFPMGAPGKTNETLESFLGRFLATIAPLQLPDHSKISHLKRTIAVRYIDRSAYIEETDSFQKYLKGIRAIDDTIKSAEARPKTTFADSKTRPTRAAAATRKDVANAVPRTSAPFNYLRRFPPHVQTKIKTEGRCGKCFKKGHVYTQADAPCKNEEPISMKDGQAQLAQMGIDWDGQYLEERQPETEGMEPKLYEEEYLPNDHTSEFSEN